MNNTIRNFNPEEIKLKRVYVKDTHPESDFRNIPGQVIDMRYVTLNPNEEAIPCLIVKYESTRPLPINDKNIEFIEGVLQLKSL